MGLSLVLQPESGFAAGKHHHAGAGLGSGGGGGAGARVGAGAGDVGWRQAGVGADDQRTVAGAGAVAQPGGCAAMAQRGGDRGAGGGATGGA